MSTLGLSHLENYMDCLFETSRDALCIIDSNACFLRTNPAFDRLLGYGSENLTGLSFSTIIHKALKSDDNSTFSCSPQYFSDCLEPVSMELIAQNDAHIPVLCRSKAIHQLISDHCNEEFTNSFKKI